MRANDMRGAASVFGAAPEARLALIRALWPQLVGAQVARQTEVVSLTGDFLRVRVADPRWRKVLPRLRRDVLNRLQQAMGALAPRQIGLLEGRLESAAQAPVGLGHEDAPPALRAPSAPPPAVLEAACAIGDEALRGHFLGVASRYLKMAETRRRREPGV